MSELAGPRSSPRDDLDDLEPVAGLQWAAGELGWRDRLAIVLDHDASRQKLLRQQELGKRTRELRFDQPSIRNDHAVPHSYFKPLLWQL